MSLSYFTSSLIFSVHTLGMQKSVHLLSFQLLTGTNYTTGWIPTELKEVTFQTLLTHCTLLNDHYKCDGQSYILKATR